MKNKEYEVLSIENKKRTEIAKMAGSIAIATLLTGTIGYLNYEAINFLCKLGKPSEAALASLALLLPDALVAYLDYGFISEASKHAKEIKKLNNQENNFELSKTL